MVDVDLLPSAKPLNIRQTRMSADLDAVVLAGLNRLRHDQGVASVEAAGDVGVVDHGDELVVWSALGVGSRVS